MSALMVFGFGFVCGIAFLGVVCWIVIDIVLPDLSHYDLYDTSKKIGGEL